MRAPLERTVTDGSITVAVLDYGGDGVPLVLLHGGGRTAADWHMTASKLDDDIRPVAVDFGGHGRSPKMPTWGIERGVAECGAVIAVLELDNPVVAGHSLGGMVSSIYAARHGARALFNVDGHGGGHPSQFDGLDVAEVEAALDEFARMSVESFEAEPDEGDDAWLDAQMTEAQAGIASLGVRWEEAEPLVRRSYRQVADGRWQQSPSSTVNVSMYLSLRGLDMMESYRALKCPSLILRTTEEEPDDPELGRLLAAYNVGLERQLAEVAADNPCVTLERVDCGHMVPLERPDWLAERCTSLIAGLGRP